MSGDLTKKIIPGDREVILTAVQNLESFVRSSLDRLDSRLQILEQKVEQRLHDTRPIWHKVVADIALLQKGQDELSRIVHEVSRDQIVVTDSLRKIQMDFHYIVERLHKLEGRRPHASL